MKVFARLVFIFIVGILWFGCSDSTPSTPNYPLTLTVDSAIEASNAPAVAFSLTVTKSGTPISGATLIQTDANPPYIDMFNQTALSNSAGIFPEFFVFYDTVTEVAFQAFKDTIINNVRDTLMSNTVTYQMP